MYIIHKNRLNEYEVDDIWKLLILCDKEFVPSLSSRNSTTQRDLNNSINHNEYPTEYLKNLLNQEFVLSKKDGKVVGFLSYIPNRSMEIEGEMLDVMYISTIIVNPDYRNTGLTKGMYNLILNESSRVVTRTWSTNYTHLHILEGLGFKVIERVENGRGIGVDTLVFLKEVEGYE